MGKEIIIMDKWQRKSSAIYTMDSISYSSKHGLCWETSDEADDIKNQKIDDAEGNFDEETINQKKSSSEFNVYAIPALLGTLLLTIMVVDQGTDIVATYQICTTQCQCAWFPDEQRCDAPASMMAADDHCIDAFGNVDQLREYCGFNVNQNDCNNYSSWRPSAYRHPGFCLTSIATIIVPSIINSTYLLFSMWVLYPSVLKYLGLSDSSWFFRLFKITLLLLYILQLLPYTWLAMNLVIGLKAWEIGSTMIGKETWDKTTNKWRLIFSILEDTPHLIIHSVFVMNSDLAITTPPRMMTMDNAGMFSGRNMLYIGSYIGITSSAASIALTLTLFKGLSTYKSYFIQFFTTFVSIGVRAGVCASYAASIFEGFGPLTWPFVWPPLTVIGLFIIEKIYFFVYRYNWNASSTVNDQHSLRKTGIAKHMKNFTHRIISLTYEGSSVECLISSYTYLAFAIALRTAWISTTGEFKGTYTTTETTFVAIQYLALASLVLNLLIVQWEGKHKIRCLAYSLIFLFFMGGIYVWAQIDLKSFRNLYFPSIRDNIHPIQDILTLTLSSLTFVFSISGIVAFVNLLIIIIRIRKKK
ncbi:unnamed protein product [Meganyctiphanes norvegica]|uniref:Uncharacterized protein n=1 Tax=Meganyctiphanes norvegica TaxID=48144 RepID=A0AAV2Q514_MEGNR